MWGPRKPLTCPACHWACRWSSPMQRTREHWVNVTSYCSSQANDKGRPLLKWAKEAQEGQPDTLQSVDRPSIAAVGSWAAVAGRSACGGSVRSLATPSRCELSLPHFPAAGASIRAFKGSESTPPQMGPLSQGPPCPDLPWALWVLTPLCNLAGGHLTPLVQIKVRAWR